MTNESAMRKQFEAAVKEKSPKAPLTPWGNGYLNLEVNSAWWAWQAACALQKPEPQGVPDGWQLVPKEPTNGILHALQRNSLAQIHAWKDALSAAPQPPAVQSRAEIRAEAINEVADYIAATHSGESDVHEVVDEIRALASKESQS